jgi:hypothetical protein
MAQSPMAQTRRPRITSVNGSVAEVDDHAVQDEDSPSPLSSPSQTNSDPFTPAEDQMIEGATANQLTPYKRRKSLSSVMTYAKENAFEAARTALALASDTGNIKPPCLISRKCEEMDFVETCHVIPRAVSYSTVSLCFFLCFISLMYVDISLISLNGHGDLSTSR